VSGEALLPPGPLADFATGYVAAMGAPDAVAREVAEHLVAADLAGVASHGTMRLAQYYEWAREGMFDPGGAASITARDPLIVDGGNGFGIAPMRLMIDEAVAHARETGIAAGAVVNTGHTGRIGTYAETAAEAGCLAIILGGGSGRYWRQVAPYGGAKAMLPTNPYAIGVPGGAHGPVVLDFATSAAAGGKVYGAHYAGAALPEGLIIDAEGRPSTDPGDYIAGGALLAMGGPKGYGMALVAELIGAALLGPLRSGMNWLAVVVDLARFGDGQGYRAAAEALLADLRACPPAPGHDRVEIPGERERRLVAQRRVDGIPMPHRTLDRINGYAAALGLVPFRR